MKKEGKKLCRIKERGGESIMPESGGRDNNNCLGKEMNGKKTQVLVKRQQNGQFWKMKV